MNTAKQKNRYREAVQWIHALTTLFILALIWFSQNLFESGSAHSHMPSVPPVTSFEQKSYWNQEMEYGFQGEWGDTYKNFMASGVDRVAVDPQEGVVFEDARVRVSFYPSLSIEEIEARHDASRPRAYSRLSRGIAVVE